MMFFRRTKKSTPKIKEQKKSLEIYKELFEVTESKILLAASAFNGIMYYDKESSSIRSGSPKDINPNFGFYYVDGGAKFIYFDKEKREAFNLISDGVNKKIKFSDLEEGILIDIIHTTCDGIGFRSSEFNLICTPDGNLSFKSKNALNWETYGIIPFVTLEYFTKINSDQWIDTNSLKSIEFRGFEREDGKTTMDCGAFKLRLSGRPGPVLVKNDKTSYSLYDSFSKKRALRKYNPLIYLCVSGKDSYFECLKIAVNSIFKFGKYTGKVAIISNRDEEQLKHLFEECPEDSIIYFKSICDNPLFERYKIFDHDISAFNPILYLDTDIVVSDEINNLTTHQFHPEAHNGGNGLWNWRSLTMRRRPRVNHESLLRLRFAG